MRYRSGIAGAVAAACVAGCGAATTGGPAPAVPSAAASTGAATVSGVVSSIAGDAYGPIVLGPTTYDANAGGAPLPGAAVVIGPVPVTGATAPATAPAGDVIVTTDARGAFVAKLAAPPAAPTASEPFVVPSNVAFAFVPPPAGYYVEVFGSGSDGTSAGAFIPVHRFVAPSDGLILRVSSPSAAEAAALAAVNADRAANGTPSLIFDETAEEVARLHAADESASGYTCHYDTADAGPSSRYVTAGGMGLTGEALALAGGADARAAFGVAESAFIAEKAFVPVGGHAANILDPTHRWAGLAAIRSVQAPAFFNVDYELITPNGQSAAVGPAGYGVTAGCPAQTVANQS